MGNAQTCDELISTPQASLSQARLVAWSRILEAVAEQREALDHRIWREDPDDTHLEADCQTWCELTRALADFLQARRAA
jgi:hypothetical protein